MAEEDTRALGRNGLRDSMLGDRRGERNQPNKRLRRMCGNVGGRLRQHGHLCIVTADVTCAAFNTLARKACAAWNPYGMATDRRLTYGSYLRVDELLSLQQPQSEPAHHDELLFIIIHQVYELWFRQLLHEIEAAMRNLAADDLLKVGKNFRRIHAIQRLLEQQVDVLETMTPQEFNAFRAGLNPASGFQSTQFREIEFLCGTQKTGYLTFLEPTSTERARLEARLAAPTLPDALKALLVRHGFQTQDSAALIATYRTIYENEEQYYALYLLLEDCIEFDERFLLWRGRHVRMVERMIGMKSGTGGSLGARYLQTTLDKRFFPELWDMRTYLGTDSTEG